MRNGVMNHKTNYVPMGEEMRYSTHNEYKEATGLLQRHPADTHHFTVVEEYQGHDRLVVSVYRNPTV